MELQQIFDDTVRHLHRQGCAAKMDVVSESGHTMPSCAYRGKNGTKCAVGYWIPDDRYSDCLEGNGIGPSRAKGSPLLALPDEIQDTEGVVDLLKGLQAAHDNAFITDTSMVWTDVWSPGGIAARLRGVAESNGLKSDLVLELWPR